MGSILSFKHLERFVVYSKLNVESQASWTWQISWQNGRCSQELELIGPTIIRRLIFEACRRLNKPIKWRSFWQQYVIWVMLICCLNQEFWWFRECHDVISPPYPLTKWWFSWTKIWSNQILWAKNGAFFSLLFFFPVAWDHRSPSRRSRCCALRVFAVIRAAAWRSCVLGQVAKALRRFWVRFGHWNDCGLVESYQYYIKSNYQVYII